MKGKYKGYCPVLSCIGIVVGMLSALPCASGDPATLAIFLLIFTVGMAVFVLSMNAPCRVRAGRRGFTVTVLGVENTFRYDDIKDISCKYCNTRMGGMIKLYITDSMGEKVFHEVCGNDNMTELIGDPANANRPQLAQLCDFVKQAKGAAE